MKRSWNLGLKAPELWKDIQRFGFWRGWSVQEKPGSTPQA
jgi:hypothetical protein